MTRQDLIKIGKETIEITEKGYYYKNNKQIRLPEKDYASIEVYNRKKLTDILDDADDYFEYFYAPKTHSIYIENMDSFEAAKKYYRPLVMNFANAHHPGGGFLNGAKAQEESLCRTSTLYKSLSSDKASEMYSYNNSHLNSLDSDYMMLSPNVCVFRDRNCDLLDTPYMVSVFTIAAINKNGMAHNIPQNKIDDVMMERIRFFLMAAARNSYEHLILGAWGCGAFGHDAKTVAEYFREILIDEKMIEFFETVTFAIIDNGEQRKLKAFTEVFGGTSIEYGECGLSDNYYTQAAYPMPVCNHTTQADEHNIGYAQGIFSDGIPFEAELWNGDNNSLNLSVYIPELEDIESWASEDVTDAASDGNPLAVDLRPLTVYSILCIGMAERDKKEILQKEAGYTNYLVAQEILHYKTSVHNQIVRYLTDIEGNDLVEIIVTLQENGIDFAETNLQFRRFPNAPKKSYIKIIK